MEGSHFTSPVALKWKYSVSVRSRLPRTKEKRKSEARRVLRRGVVEAGAPPPPEPPPPLPGRAGPGRAGRARPGYEAARFRFVRICGTQSSMKRCDVASSSSRTAAPTELDGGGVRRRRPAHDAVTRPGRRRTHQYPHMDRRQTLMNHYHHQLATKTPNY